MAYIANDNTKISVRFEHASVHEDKPFEQPLFYIAMNIKHRLLKEQGKSYNEKMKWGSGLRSWRGLPP
jgi:hypothetical protein